MNSKLYSTGESLFGLQNLRTDAQGQTLVDVVFEAGSSQIDSVGIQLAIESGVTSNFNWRSELQGAGWTTQSNLLVAGINLSGFSLSSTASGTVVLGTLVMNGVDSSDFTVGLNQGLTAYLGADTYHADSVSGATSYRFETDDLGMFVGSASGELDYTLDAVRDLTEVETGRVVSASDALSALKLAVGINPNASLDVSAYQLLSADVNKMVA